MDYMILQRFLKNNNNMNIEIFRKKSTCSILLKNKKFKKKAVQELSFHLYLATL